MPPSTWAVPEVPEPCWLRELGHGVGKGLGPGEHRVGRVLAVGGRAMGMPWISAVWEGPWVAVDLV